MKNEKKVMLLSLTVLAILLTGFTWAYWNSGEVKAANLSTSSNTIEIGQGKQEAVETFLEMSVEGETSHGVLVPKTVDEKQSQIQIPYTVLWNTDSDLISGAKGTIAYKNARLTLAEDTDKEEVNELLEKLFTIHFNDLDKEIHIGQEKDIFVTVSFEKEPANKKEYDLIASQKIVLHFDLEVEEIH